MKKIYDLVGDLLRREAKNSQIKEEINRLEVIIPESTIIRISECFLRAQYIEYLIKELIVEIEMNLWIAGDDTITQKAFRNIEDFKELTFRRLRNELENVKMPEVVEIYTKLESFIKHRNKFVHHVFTSIDDKNKLHSESIFHIQESKDLENLINKTLSIIRRHNKILLDNRFNK